MHSCLTQTKQVLEQYVPLHHLNVPFPSSFLFCTCQSDRHGELLFQRADRTLNGDTWMCTPWLSSPPPLFYRSRPCESTSPHPVGACEYRHTRALPCTRQSHGTLWLLSMICGIRPEIVELDLKYLKIQTFQSYSQVIVTKTLSFQHATLSHSFKASFFENQKS